MEEVAQLMVNTKKTGSLTAVVFWMKDKKISKEPVGNIKCEGDPEEGQVAQVRFGKGKSYYPAKILKISEDGQEVEKFFHNFLQKMEEHVQEGTSNLPEKPITAKAARSEKKKQGMEKIKSQKALAAKALEVLEGQQNKKRADTSLVLSENPMDVNVSESSSTVTLHTSDPCTYAISPTSTGCSITEAVNTVLWPDSYDNSNLYRPVPVYPQRPGTSYTSLFTRAEEFQAWKEKYNQLEEDLAQEKAKHALEILTMQTAHAKEIEVMKLKIEKLQNQSRQADSLPASEFTPGKIKFLRDLASDMQDRLHKKEELATSTSAGCRKRLHLDPVYTADKLHEADPFTRSSSGYDIPLQEVVQSPSDSIPLVDDITDVLITKEQRSACLLKADGKPELLVRELLAVFFSMEQLANGSALGVRNAHNSKVQTTVGLDFKVISAIKRFVLLKFKQPSGQPILKDKDFNAVINSKCATARRALQVKMQ